MKTESESLKGCLCTPPRNSKTFAFSEITIKDNKKRRKTIKTKIRRREKNYQRTWKHRKEPRGDRRGGNKSEGRKCWRQWQKTWLWLWWKKQKKQKKLKLKQTERV